MRVAHRRLEGDGKGRRVQKNRAVLQDLIGKKGVAPSKGKSWRRKGHEKDEPPESGRRTPISKTQSAKSWRGKRRNVSRL